MNCCFPLNNITELCHICYNPCSIFEIKIIDNDTPICNCCYKIICQEKLNPENKKALLYNEKNKLYINNEMYSLRGPYVLNMWGQIVGDIVNNTIKMRTFLNEVCFLCKGQVSTLKETYINGQIYHYECSKLIIY